LAFSRSTRLLTGQPWETSGDLTTGNAKFYAQQRRDFLESVPRWE